MCALLLALSLHGLVAAQNIKARITVLSLSPARVKIEGERAGGAADWSFRKEYAGVSGLGERIENFSLSDPSGSNIVARRVAAGEYAASAPATRFAYEVKLEPPAQATDAAHVSWLTTERGLLLPGDLLPRNTTGGQSGNISAALSFVLPSNWNIVASETKQPDGSYTMTDARQSVFLVGTELRQKQERVGQMLFSYATAGPWAFTDEEAAGMAASLLKEHADVMGGPARQNVQLVLIPFPRTVGAERWSAETRGSTVVLLSGQSPSRTAALAQLSVPLAHELFHLWVPNALALDGEYDWFYEGFTTYQATRAGMRLHLLGFQDYLNALGRAFDAYKSIAERDQLSLVEASRRRWREPTALVYHKGLVVAYLYDLNLRLQTSGSRSLDDVYRELFRLHHSAMARAEGNSAVIGLLAEQKGMQEFVRQYVERAGPIDLQAAVEPFGLEILAGGVRTHLDVKPSLSRAQRDLWRKFGYNEETQRRR